MHRPNILGLTLALGAVISVPAMAQTGSSVTYTAGETTAPAASETPLPAKTLIDQAVKVAKAEKKTVFVHVGASWCGWCHKLDQALHSKEVAPIITAHYVMVPLDALEQGDKKSLENPGVDSVMTSLGLTGGPPMYAFIDGDGKKIASSFVLPGNANIGYPASAEEIKAFGALLEKTAPRMTEADRTKITEYLTANAPQQ